MSDDVPEAFLKWTPVSESEERIPRLSSTSRSILVGENSSGRKKRRKSSKDLPDLSLIWCLRSFESRPALSEQDRLRRELRLRTRARKRERRSRKRERLKLKKRREFAIKKFLERTPSTESSPERYVDLKYKKDGLRIKNPNFKKNIPIIASIVQSNSSTSSEEDRNE